METTVHKSRLFLSLGIFQKEGMHRKPRINTFKKALLDFWTNLFPKLRLREKCIVPRRNSVLHLHAYLKLYKKKNFDDSENVQNHSKAFKVRGSI